LWIDEKFGSIDSRYNRSRGRPADQSGLFFSAYLLTVTLVPVNLRAIFHFLFCIHFLR
jgi:hypothetical protein